MRKSRKSILAWALAFAMVLPGMTGNAPVKVMADEAQETTPLGYDVTLGQSYSNVALTMNLDGTDYAAFVNIVDADFAEGNQYSVSANIASGLENCKLLAFQTNVDNWAWNDSRMIWGNDGIQAGSSLNVTLDVVNASEGSLKVKFMANNVIDTENAAEQITVVLNSFSVNKVGAVEEEPTEDSGEQNEEVTALGYFMNLGETYTNVSATLASGQYGYEASFEVQDSEITVGDEYVFDVVVGAGLETFKQFAIQSGLDGWAWNGNTGKWINDGWTAGNTFSITIPVTKENLSGVQFKLHADNSTIDDVSVTFEMKSITVSKVAPEVPDDNEDPTPEVPGGNEDPTPEVPSGNEDPTPEVPSGNEDPTPEVPSGNEDPIPEVPSGNEDPTPEVPSGNEDPTPEVPSGDDDQTSENPGEDGEQSGDGDEENGEQYVPQGTKVVSGVHYVVDFTDKKDKVDAITITYETVGNAGGGFGLEIDGGWAQVNYSCDGGVSKVTFSNIAGRNATGRGEFQNWWGEVYLQNIEYTLIDVGEDPADTPASAGTPVAEGTQYKIDFSDKAAKVDAISVTYKITGNGGGSLGLSIDGGWDQVKYSGTDTTATVTYSGILGRGATGYAEFQNWWGNIEILSIDYTVVSGDSENSSSPAETPAQVPTETPANNGNASQPVVQGTPVAEGTQYKIDFSDKADTVNAIIVTYTIKGNGGGTLGISIDGGWDQVNYSGTDTTATVTYGNIAGRGATGYAEFQNWWGDITIEKIEFVMIGNEDATPTPVQEETPEETPVAEEDHQETPVSTPTPVPTNAPVEEYDDMQLTAFAKYVLDFSDKADKVEAIVVTYSCDENCGGGLGLSIDGGWDQIEYSADNGINTVTYDNIAGRGANGYAEFQVWWGTLKLIKVEYIMAQDGLIIEDEETPEGTADVDADATEDATDVDDVMNDAEVIDDGEDDGADYIGEDDSESANHATTGSDTFAGEAALPKTGLASGWSFYAFGAVLMIGGLAITFRKREDA